MYTQGFVHLLKSAFSLVKVVPYDFPREFPIVFIVHFEQLSKDVHVNNQGRDGRGVICGHLVCLLACIVVPLLHRSGCKNIISMKGAIGHLPG